MNDVPVDYYAGVDPATGRRTDEAQRPELACGSVEYVAPTEYMVSGLRVQFRNALSSPAARWSTSRRQRLW